MLSASFKKSSWKALKVISLSFGGVLVLLFILPFLFPKAVSNKIKTWANNSITSEMNFSKARLSFFNHFPSLTLTLYDFSLKGSAPFEQDTLVVASEVSLGVDLSTIFSKTIQINEIYLTKGNVHVQVDTDGRPNYNIYESTAPAKASKEDTSGASLNIDRIQLEHCRIIYNDRSLALNIKANDVNYKGKGNLKSNKFDLYSRIGINSFDLSYGGIPYIQSKKLKGDLITRINTKSLDLVFEKNDLKINQLPVQFKGEFSFLRNGYEMDFLLSSGASTLEALFSALPSKYLSWMEHTDIEGDAELSASLKGKYVANANKMPDFTFKIKVRDGEISSSGASSKIEKLRLDFITRLPQLNPDRLTINLDSLSFQLDKGHLDADIDITSLTKPLVKARMDADIDMEKWTKAIGYDKFKLKGHLQAKLKADGRYIPNVSVPAFDFTSTFSNGSLHFEDVSEPIKNIGFVVAAYSRDNSYANVHLDVSRINAEALTNYIKGNIQINNALAPNIDANLVGLLHMEEIKQFYPVDGIDLHGDVRVNVVSKGPWVPAQKLFPVTTASLKMSNGAVKTKYYPHPIEKINVDAVLVDTTGNFNALRFDIKPVAFEFEGQPFHLKAAVDNFNDPHYDISANGSIDLGKIYKVLGKEGYDVNGMIKADLSLHGTQSDAMSGQYAKLDNKGSLTVKDITVKANIFPLPFHINNGVFRFADDKMWFDQFDVHYGKSDLHIDGYLNNLIGYMTQQDQHLQGALDLKSRYLQVDELAAYTGNSDPADAAAGAPGVVIIPANVRLTVNAAADRVNYNGIDLHRFHGTLGVENGTLNMSNTGFNIIDAPVVMDAQYTSLSARRAQFDFRISAKEFDIKRAYKEIKLFHDMATSASSASGIVGLEYHINGRLYENMKVSYPSLTGEGVLTLKKIKLKGFKLLNTVSNKTGKEDLKDPGLSEVNIRSSIANNIITIERTKLRIAGMRPRFEGQVSLDGRLNLKGRVGLPPLGIWGIPFYVTGTQHNPVVKLGRNKDMDLQEGKEE
ncbi:AsmA family protein [Chitinophaga sancti]|uniref:AsmA protein n=1 Tax=Chitinophaga sancti TaxID=1004 RepID=A0A1K1SP70_9BACT|nr:AsmA-like C-terminal region-containing protein [Chitinophaga sancti]WQD64387.1 AsmA-like C-terminal region-containing protein [Chitinophaga sancti]WQG89989.1 AsmA-like C-terminal region-containing protein [Chitinophaga sancti]SFW86090.1 AsmA protein [Chitinophaga sancti]